MLSPRSWRWKRAKAASPNGHEKLFLRCQTWSTVSEHGAGAGRCQQTSEDPVPLVPGTLPARSWQAAALRHTDTCLPGPGSIPLASHKAPGSHQMVVEHPCCAGLDWDQRLVGWARAGQAGQGVLSVGTQHGTARWHLWPCPSSGTGNVNPIKFAGMPNVG